MNNVKDLKVLAISYIDSIIFFAACNIACRCDQIGRKHDCLSDTNGLWLIFKREGETFFLNATGTAALVYNFVDKD